jgi:molybdopterin molybdotransferase
MIDYCNIDTNGLLSIEQALQLIKESVSPFSGDERAVLKQALGRVLSQPVNSPINIPPERNSAMDGYAFCSSEIQKNQPFTLSVAGTSWAGRPYLEKIGKTECVRIYTGAVIPDNADSVIMQEQIEIDNKKIVFPATTVSGQNIREAGGDIKQNAELLPANKKLSAIDIGLLASAGIYDVLVKRKLNIAFFSTGDELCAIGQSLKPGGIFDSNRYALSGLLKDDSFNISDLGVIPDDKQRIKSTLLTAAKTHDVIITTGGASVGDADYIKEVLDECGKVGFWKIAIKPGKPLAFGKINSCHFFGLPGNPVSVIATFQKIVAPALRQLSGMQKKKTLSLSATCLSDLKKQKGRQEYQRGILAQNEFGELSVKSAGQQGSNIMTAMSKANCYIVLPVDSEGVFAGQKVMVEPFDILV